MVRESPYYRHTQSTGMGEQVGEPGHAAAVMPSAGGSRYTPSSNGAVERIVRLFNQYYPRRTASECRELLALLYGHPSWALLEAAIASDAPSAWDEDETAERVHARREDQCRFVLEHFGGVTPEATASAGRIEKELNAAGMLSISKRHDPYWRRQRIERARHAYNVAYARHAVLEIRPTAKDRLAIPANDDTLHMSLRLDLLPRAIVFWLEHQRPRLNGLADRIAALHARQHSQCDILNFAFVWGEACISHPTEIPEALQVYPLALCAKWYAWNACAELLPAPDAAEAGVILHGTVSALPGALDPALEHQRTLLRAQPREDAAQLSPMVRERQIAAGYGIMRQHMQDAASASPNCHFISKPAWSGKAAAAGRVVN